MVVVHVVLLQAPVLDDGALGLQVEVAAVDTQHRRLGLLVDASK